MIRIKELFRLQNITHLRLIAGQDGLERTVTEAVLFEYDPSRVQLPDFYRGDLVVTTLAYARGDAQLVGHSLLALMNQGIAGLLVKTAYFTELPESVLALADKLGTPIFLFDDTYIEEVILQVTDLIRGKRHFAGYEQELTKLMRGGMTDDQTRESARRISPMGLSGYRIAALYPKERMADLDERLYMLLGQSEQDAPRYVFMEWRQMILALCRANERGECVTLAQVDDLLERAGIKRERLVVGLSDPYEDALSLGTALCEAVYAARAAQLQSKSELEAQGVGLYAYLFPMSENPFICGQCRRVLASIREYDAQNHTNLEHTAQVYVQQNMEIAATAKMLFQHPNTVRYRLAKIQRIMNMQDDPLFEPMLSLTLGLSQIIENP